MLHGSKTIVRLLPGAIEILRAGTLLARRDLDRADWEAHWKAGLKSLDEPLREALSQAGAPADAAHVEYRAPAANAEVLILPLPRKEAVEAATLRLYDAAGADDQPSLHISLIPEAAAGTRTALLGVAEGERTLDALSSWIARAGMKFTGATPTRAAHLHAAVHAAMKHTGSALRAVAVLDEDGGALAGAASGTLLFARGVDTGLDLLAEAYSRAMRDIHGVTAATIRQTLLTHGIPKRDAVIDERSGLLGEKALPLLQPVIQRLAVEIKQTLRFGLPEGEAARAALTIAGAGAKIPGLAAVLSSVIDIPVESDEAALSRVSAPPALLGKAARGRRERGLITAALTAGTIAAAVFVVGDTLRLRQAQTAVEAHITANEPLIEALHARQEESRRADTLRRDTAKLDKLLSLAIGARAPWNAQLRELTRLGIPGLAVTELMGSYSGDTGKVVVKGTVSSADSSDPIAALVDRLAASPLVASVELGPTRAAEGDAGKAVQFVLTLTLKSLAHDARLSAEAPASPVQASAGGDS